MECHVIGVSSGATRIKVARDGVSCDRGEHGRHTHGTLRNEVPCEIRATRAVHALGQQKMDCHMIGASMSATHIEHLEIRRHTRGTLKNEVPFAIGATQAPHASRQQEIVK
ncbi:hypothetical protein TIFTF001_016895 [Ficus carica]|uniref:Uncharacterized protein n=1 Tax=Ficus carica TaxID=3494 RepID=A0AA88A165_FICCA|nr:hypothetical protein TIFTF001_016895 [Ficus carica]